MNMSEQKNSLRISIKKKIQELSQSQKVRLSQQVVSTIEDNQHFIDCDLLCIYIPLATEVDVSPLIEQAFLKGASVAIGKVKHTTLTFHLIQPGYTDTLIKGKYGILEPPDKTPIVNISTYTKPLCIVPGLAFSITKDRLGRGKGFYDRFLSTIENRVITMGVCFDCQLLEEVPHEDFDKPMDSIISDKRVIG